MLDVKYNEKTGTFDVLQTEPDPAPTPSQAPQPEQSAVASMEQTRVLGGLEDVQLFGVPIGTAIVGGSTALIASEVLDGVLETDQGVMRGVVKLIAGGAVVNVLGGFLGMTAARSAASFLAFDATRDILPIDNLIRDLVGGLTGGGTASQSRQRQVPGIDEPATSLTNGTDSEERLLDQLASQIQ